jgi:hypothetical protein
MSWALGRRLIIIAIIAVVIGGVVFGTGYLFVHKTPTCTDGKQNQKEEGIDCGGTCPYLCIVSQAAPSVRFVRTFSPLPGRTDAVAYIDNPNSKSAATGARFKIELYDDRNVVIAKGEGGVDLPAGATVPVYIPNFFSGSQVVARAFLTFDESSLHWFTSEYRKSPIAVRDVLFSEQEPPRITATLVNDDVRIVRNTHLIVTLFDAQGTAVAASQTIAPEIAGKGTAQAVFTWPSALGVPISRIDVLPLLTPSP